MKRICVFAVLMLLAALPGCGAKEEPALMGIIFDRGHGSMWGNQLYMEVRDSEIVTLRYVGKDSGEFEETEHLPILPEQWTALKDAVGKLELKKERTTRKEKLFGQNKLDGGEYRKLTLTFARGEKETEETYRWPGSPEAQALEELLEQLAQASIENQNGQGGAEP